MKLEKVDVSDFNGEDFTKITFKPDLKRFKMSTLEDDTVALFKKRVT